MAVLFTDIEGAARGFDRGFVTSSKDSKTELLGIGPSLLDHNVAVSEVVARSIVEGALNRSGANFAIGVTGFAGPAAPGEEEGLVHIAFARRNSRTIHREEHFGPVGCGAIRLKSLKAMRDIVEQAFEEE